MLIYIGKWLHWLFGAEFMVWLFCHKTVSSVFPNANRKAPEHVRRAEKGVRELKHDVAHGGGEW